jgi:hypothetical protein
MSSILDDVWGLIPSKDIPEWCTHLYYRDNIFYYRYIDGSGTVEWGKEIMDIQTNYRGLVVYFNNNYNNYIMVSKRPTRLEHIKKRLWFENNNISKECEWLSMDNSGYWYMYNKKPIFNSYYNEWFYVDLCFTVKINYVINPWQKSLSQKPKYYDQIIEVIK